MLLSGLVYNYKCDGCNPIHYGKTKLHFIVQIWEHFNISQFTGKEIMIDNNKLTLIQKHLLFWNYSPSFENFSVLTREINDFKLKTM